VLAELSKVSRPVLGAVARDGCLEVPLGSFELALPEFGDAEHIVAFDEDHRVVVAFGPEVQLPSDVASLVESALREGRERERAQYGRRRLDAEAPPELERAQLRLSEAVGHPTLHIAEGDEEC